MKLYLVPEQQGEYEPFKNFLQRSLPCFVKHYPTVQEALFKYGMFSTLPVPRALRSRADAVPENVVQRVWILTKALAWGFPPRFLVMGPDMMLTSHDWAGGYTGHDTIVMAKPLVQAWQKDPTDTVLYRAMIVVALHELVHFLNDQIFPGATIYPKPFHLRDSFHREAFGRPPVNWPDSHYLVLEHVLKSRGVEF